MKKSLLFVAAALGVMSPLWLNAQEVKHDGFDRLEVHYSAPEVRLDMEVAEGTEFVRLSVEGYEQGGSEGRPALPVRSSLIALPFCEGWTVETRNEQWDTLSLGGTPMPLQPLQVKGLDGVPLRIDSACYAADTFWAMELAHVEYLGMARDKRLARLAFAPVRINPARRLVAVCRAADVVVRFVAADAVATLDHYARYHTPAYSTGGTLNDLFSKAEVASMPVRMVIMAPEVLRCHALEEFAAWKRKQGMMAEIHYTSDPLNEGAAYLQQLYDEATPQAPAPVYVLLVGDHEQLPAFASRISYTYYDLNMGNHITDLYYATWDGDDKIPEAYAGRFSATDTATLAAIVAKTLMYERYEFPDDSYLAKGVLVSGRDAGSTRDNAYLYADPTMDYIASFYLNAANGYDTVVYYKNRSNYAPNGITVTGSSSPSNVATTLRRLYSEGMGWINYSAHGDWDRWTNPALTVSHVGSMNNYDKPSFMIGSCCLSNQFDKAVCLGEALLRRSGNAGAVAYIGASQETVWAPDFYWVVGFRDNVSGTMVPQYKASNLGAYDRMFHTHGESADQCYVTASSMLAAGNMAVSTMTLSQEVYRQLKGYYWEIYHLMGDPSLLPWAGRAATLGSYEHPVGVQAYHDDPDGDRTAEVYSVPNAYLSLTDTLTDSLVYACHADAAGIASMPVPDEASHYRLGIIAQGYKPFFVAMSDLRLMSEGIATAEGTNAPVIYPNPATSMVVVQAPGSTWVRLYGTDGRLVAQQAMKEGEARISVQGLPAGIYMVETLASGAHHVQKLIVR